MRGVCRAQNKWADRSRPLVVHACSSTTYPYSHFNIYRQSVYAFYEQNPCKLRFTLGPYVRCGLHLCLHITSAARWRMCERPHVVRPGIWQGQAGVQCGRATQALCQLRPEGLGLV